VFSTTLPLAERFADLLATTGVLRGLIGPREAPRLWERHLINCALLGEAVPPEADVCDLGSGAGLPGLVLALRRPDLRVTLVEPLLRRTTFLDEAAAELGLLNVEVVRGRAESLHGQREFTVVTSRALAPLSRLVDWSLPLVRPGGALLAMKGVSVLEEIDSAQAALRRHGAGAVSVETYGTETIDPPTRVVRVRMQLDRRRTAESQRGSPAASDRPTNKQRPRRRTEG
jgi:16S rRNA (guanine527-N7)-methyltransferase